MRPYQTQLTDLKYIQPRPIGAKKKFLKGITMASSNRLRATSFFQKKLIASSIATALGLSGAPFATGQEASLEEVIVTARQRAESSQDIPMMINSLTGEDLQKQGITTLEDFSRFIGSLNVVSTTPGQNDIIFRGVSDGGGYLVDASASFYLDEQPMTVTSMAPDVYPVDIARIEALAGPQATLYGASSQTGAIRLITNKPDPSEFTANIGLGASSTSSGDGGYDFDATVNIPISDNFAVRFSAFSAEDGGFIDSVPGVTVYDESSGLGGTKTNAGFVEDDINGVEWRGGRAAAKWLISEDWSATVSANFQKIDADGFNDFDPGVGDLQTVKFSDELRVDDWHQMSLVIEGDLGFAQLTVAGSYYDRETMYHHDTQTYTAYYMYTFGVAGGYASYDFGSEPTGYLVNDQQNKATTFEARLTGSSDKLDWTAGIFYNDNEEYWDFKSYVEGYNDSGAAYYWRGLATYYDTGTIPATDAWWHSTQGTNRTDTAIFGELDYKITDRLSLLLGGRYYEVERDIGYFNVKPEGNPGLPAAGISGPCAPTWCGDRIPDREVKDDGFMPKLGFQFDISDDVMVYAVYSEGYRAGGINRGKGIPSLPLAYESDIVENKEIGIKSTLLDGRVQLNATIYKMDWKDVQLELTDPSNNILRPPPESDPCQADDADANYCKNQPFQDVVVNAGNATVKGLDLDIKALLSDNLQFGVNITKIDEAIVSGNASFPDDRFVGGQVNIGLGSGTTLPMFADVAYSLYLEYGTPVNFLGGGDGRVRIQHSYNGESYNQISGDAVSPRLMGGDYRITDVILGYETGDWQAQLTVNNISDERGIVYRDTSDYDAYYGRGSDVVIRPRNISVSIRKNF